MTRPTILLSLDWRRPKDPKTGLGTASIAAALHAAGVPTQVVYDHVNRDGFTLESVKKRLATAIAAAGPDCIVGIGAFVWNEPEVQAILPWLAARGVDVVLGGPQVSYCEAGVPEAEYPDVYAFVRGYGEQGMVDLATGRGATPLNGVHIVGETDANHRSRLTLADLPSPYLLGTTEPQAFVRWETQRGCPFRCSFCQHRDANARYRPALVAQERLFAELELFAREDVKRVAVLDPIFHADESHAVAILEHARRVGFRGTLSLQCRLEMLSSEFLEACQGLDVELEFGLQTAVVAESRAVRRNNNMKAVDKGIDLLHLYDVPFEISLIYGLPTQTLDSFIESVTWCLDRRVLVIDAWPLMLLRGTPLYAQKERFGLVESTDRPIPIVVQSHTFSRSDHAEMARIADGLGRIDYPRVAA